MKRIVQITVLGYLLWLSAWFAIHLDAAARAPGAASVQGSADAGTAVLGWPILIGGKDGSSNAQYLNVDGSGNLLVNTAAGSGGSTGTPADSFAAPGAIPQSQSFPMVYGGGTWDRWREANASLANGTTGAGVPASGTGLYDGTNWQAAAVGALAVPASHAYSQAVTPMSNAVTLADAVSNSLHLPEDIATNSIGTQTFPMELNAGGTWDRTRGVNGANATSGTGLLGAAVMGFDSSNYKRLGTVDAYADGNALNGGSTGVLPSVPWIFNNTSFDRTRSTSAANLAAQSGLGGQIVSNPGMWGVTSTPVSATQATASKAAGAAGVRHVCTSLVGTLATGGTAQASNIQINLRDGATGAGTVLWSETVTLPANQTWTVSVSNLTLVGTAATAMTLEFSAAGVASSFESVALTGYDAS